MVSEKIELRQIIPFEILVEKLRKIEFRGLYNQQGEKIRPYEHVQFSLVKIFPTDAFSSAPIIETSGGCFPLFSPQPTIYLNQLEIIKTVDEQLSVKFIRVYQLEYGIEYNWEGRDLFHMIPPIIEKHAYPLKEGFIDLKKLIHAFENLFVKDGKNNLHRVTNRFLKNFFIDEVSSLKHLDVFHCNAPLINYGLKRNGLQNFHIICDGSHRIDYAIEHLHKPITAILVEATQDTSLIPYYAFPMPYFPTIRLSSKLSEKMYPRLERDKIHLFNDFLKKVLHYDWSPAGLNVSKLRSNVEIF